MVFVVCVKLYTTCAIDFSTVSVASISYVYNMYINVYIYVRRYDIVRAYLKH